jgi:putative transposase
VEIIKRSDAAKGFEVLPKRWVVERTFAWLLHHRRLVRDYEKTVASAQAFVYLAAIRIMLNQFS